MRAWWCCGLGYAWIKHCGLCFPVASCAGPAVAAAPKATPAQPEVRGTPKKPTAVKPAAGKLSCYVVLSWVWAAALVGCG